MSARPAALASLALAALGLGAPVLARAEGGVRLADVPWTEAEKLLTPERVVVLPLGAGAKEHGPHLRLGNDLILAEYFARRVLEARPVPRVVEALLADMLAELDALARAAPPAGAPQSPLGVEPPPDRPPRAPRP